VAHQAKLMATEAAAKQLAEAAKQVGCARLHADWLHPQLGDTGLLSPKKGQERLELRCRSTMKRMPAGREDS
jgi:hypothetical protein